MRKDPPRTGKVVGRALEERGLSQKSLASSLEVSPAYVSALISGRKAMSPDTANKIASALSMSAEETSGLHRAAATDQGFSLDLPDDF